MKSSGSWNAEKSRQKKQPRNLLKVERTIMIPSIVILKIQQERGFRLKLWLPVFILWPVFLILFLLVLPLLLIADLILLVCGVRIQLLRMMWGVFQSYRLCAARASKSTVVKKIQSSM
jgi:hypothetical protein